MSDAQNVAEEEREKNGERRRKNSAAAPRQGPLKCEENWTRKTEQDRGRGPEKREPCRRTNRREKKKARAAKRKRSSKRERIAPWPPNKGFPGAAANESMYVEGLREEKKDLQREKGQEDLCLLKNVSSEEGPKRTFLGLKRRADRSTKANLMTVREGEESAIKKKLGRGKDGGSARSLIRRRGRPKSPGEPALVGTRPTRLAPPAVKKTKNTKKKKSIDIRS